VKQEKTPLSQASLRVDRGAEGEAYQYDGLYDLQGRGFFIGSLARPFEGSPVENITSPLEGTEVIVCLAIPVPEKAFEIDQKWQQVAMIARQKIP
jgi:hypothetical protein